MNQTSQHAVAPPLVWDIALSRLLVHRQSRFWQSRFQQSHFQQSHFQLDIRCASHAPRLVLYGPSGAGKTQTLRMLAGIARPDRGRIAVAGRVLYDSASGIDLSPQARRLATMFQDYALFPHLTVRQNIAFARRRGWLNPRQHIADAAVDRWIATFQLEAVTGLYPQQLSGGQRQRTALARALVNEPTALLLDEPFAALDKALRDKLRGELTDLQAALGIPMLLITHDDDDVRALADDVVHLQAGRVVAGADRCGPPPPSPWTRP